VIVADVTDASSFECSPMRMHKCSGYCVGSSRREFATTTSAAAAIIDLAAASSAAHAAVHPAAPSPMTGDPHKTQLAQVACIAALGARETSAHVHFARHRTVAMPTGSQAFPSERSKIAPAVKNLLFI
jgi:hypothetical protein